MENKALNDFLAQAGYAPWHTGGGCMAWRKDTGSGTYLMLANEDASLTGDFETAEWSVTRCSDLHEGFVALSASMLVREAVSIADRLPQPSQEQTYIGTEDLLPAPVEAQNANANSQVGFDLSVSLELRAIVRGVDSEQAAREIMGQLIDAITKAHEAVDGSKYQIEKVSEFSLNDTEGQIKVSYFADDE